MSDPVNSPSHYTSVFPGFEVIEITRHMSFCAGNAFKYIARHQQKGGVEDLRKALVYLRWAKEDHSHTENGVYLTPRAEEVCGELFRDKVIPNMPDDDNSVYWALEAILCNWYASALRIVEGELYAREQVAQWLAASREALPAALDCIEEQQRRIEELEAERARPFPWLGVAVDPVEQPALDGEVPK